MNTRLFPVKAASLYLLFIPFAAVAKGSFLEDGSAELDLRNFYINEDQRSGDPDYSRVEEWGQGFLLDAESGYTPGTVGFGIDLLGQLGVRLDGGGRSGKEGITRDPGSLFPLKDNRARSEFSRIDITAKARISDTELKVGTMRPSLPVLRNNDSRLLPQTFRGAHLQSEDIGGLTLHLGQFERVSTRASSNYEKLRIGGADNPVDRFSFAGGEYEIGNDLTVEYFVGELQDYYRQHFLGATHDADLGSGTLETDLRYFHSAAIGANEQRQTGYGARGYFGDDQTSGPVDNRTASAMLTYSIADHDVSLGYQHMSGRSDFPYIDNGDGASVHLITDAQIGKFLRAGEQTWLVRYNYDFTELGLEGLSFNGTYLRGSKVRGESGGADSEWERDLRLEYTVQRGPLKDVSFLARHGSLRSRIADQRDVDETRLEVSYTLELF